MADDEGQDANPLADPNEQRVLRSALNSFRQYRSAAHYYLTHLRRQSFYSLPAKHIDILCEGPIDLPDTFRMIDDAIEHNAEVAEAIYHRGLEMFNIDPAGDSLEAAATPTDMDKARATIKQLFRDWSAEGAGERSASYTPILKALSEYHTKEPAQRHDLHILVPGAGLGRLVFELVNHGYTATGTEISYHQILASAYMLNSTTSAGQHSLHPWIHQFSNHIDRYDQLQQIKVPDILPAQTLESTTPSDVHWSERMSMTSGDFCVVYKQPENRDIFDAVVTCFFIDTGPNLLNYIEAIKHCLKPGGLWINHGPLHWHYESSHPQAQAGDDGEGRSGSTRNAGKESEGIGEPGSFELSDTEVKWLVGRCGFSILQAERSADMGYVSNSKSMIQTTYRPSFWVARLLL